MQSPRPYRRSFAIVFAASTLAVVLLVAMFNYVIDPYGVFNAAKIGGVNVVKPRPDVMLADIKLIVGTRFQPSAVILGNSRADVGFDPGYPGFAARHLRAYNAAVPGAGIDYTAGAFRQLAGTADIRLAVVGLDFLDFLYAPDERAQSSADLSASPWRTRFRALFTTTALWDSIRTLLIQRQANPAVVRADGFNPMLDYREIAATEGYSALFRQRAEEGARSLARQPHNLDVGGRRMSPAFSALRSLLRGADDEGTELQLVFYPYHLMLLLQYEEAGLWPLFEQWKEDVAAISDEARAKGTRVTLWDFSCPNALTAEAVPGAGDRASPMQWYWEAGHFKKELGDRVLATLFARGDSEERGGFGIELTAMNVKESNRVCATALATMRKQFPSLARQAADLSVSAKTRH